MIPIRQLPPYQLDELDLSGCKIRDLSPLEHLRGLLRLSLDVEEATSIQPIVNNRVLEALVLENVSQDLDLALLCDFKFLFELTLTGEVNASQINGLYRIKTLRLPAGTKLPTGFVDGLPTLRRLFVGDEQVWFWNGNGRVE